MEIDPNVAFALFLTLVAGLSTGIGSAIAFFFKRPKMSYLAFALGLSAGVMIYVSFMELMPIAIVDLEDETGNGDLWATVAFFLGILVIAVIDLLIPHDANPHEFAEEDELDAISTKEPIPSGMCTHEDKDHPEGTDAEALDALKHGAERKSTLLRAGVFTALAIAIHNFPEGLATFVTALSNPGLGIAIAVAIAIHNIPEGISVSVPIFYATGDRKKAFWISFLSGVAEPIGALVGFALLMPFLDGNPAILPGMLAFVAGIMIYISIDELLPLAHKYGKGHVVLIGLILGMFIMALSLIMLAWV
ncbi:MAG: zinc transporter ZupT [Thermoplasmata archaeon]|nr:zinc transporter ZupT [Thermoplasmata archaeon]